MVAHAMHSLLHVCKAHCEWALAALKLKSCHRVFPLLVVYMLHACAEAQAP